MKLLKLLCLVLPLALIAAGFKSEPEKVNELSKSLLQAAADGDADEVKSLISKGANLNARNWRGTALHVAAQHGHKQVTESLIATGANVNVRRVGAGVTPLHCAAVYGHKDIAEVLIDKGADVKIQDTLGCTPLHWAASGGHRDVAKLLVAEGADVNAVQAQGLTPLHEAAKWGHPDVAELLINKGANVNAEDKDGRTPLWYAKASGNEEIVGLLPKQGLGHDVAVANILVPSSCTQGDRVSVVVDVVNRSDYSEALVVTLTDVTDATTIGMKSVHFSPAGFDGMDEICDLIFPSPAGGTNYFGGGIYGGGDVNGDGYDDLIITGSEWNNSYGRAYLYFGGPNMDANPDKTFVGEHAGDHFGDLGCVLGDVNNDNYADVIVGARGYKNNQGRVYIYLGGPDMDEKADIILEGEEGAKGYFGLKVDAGDVDNDGYDDILVTAPTMNSRKGRAYLFYGGDPMDTTPDQLFEGENPNDLFGRNGIIGEDVDDDNYRDILIGARQFPGNNPKQGRAYLYYGGPRSSMDAQCDVMFPCPVSGRNAFGSSLGIFDIDNDGYADVIIGSRGWNHNTGRAYLYWGDKRANMNATPDKFFTGETGAHASFGGDELYCADFNNDNYGDIAIGAYSWYWWNCTGRVYVYYGGTKTRMDEHLDRVFTGEAPESCFGLEINGGDFDGDGYIDIVVGAWLYNNRQGRAYLYYGNPGDSTRLKFDWDTTKASVGKHILKATIDPVVGEEDTADNTMTTAVNVKEPFPVKTEALKK